MNLDPCDWPDDPTAPPPTPTLWLAIDEPHGLAIWWDGRGPWWEAASVPVSTARREDGDFWWDVDHLDDLDTHLLADIDSAMTDNWPPPGRRLIRRGPFGTLAALTDQMDGPHPTDRPPNENAATPGGPVQVFIQNPLAHRTYPGVG